jgi:hypothetical protein
MQLLCNTAAHRLSQARSHFLRMNLVRDWLDAASLRMQWPCSASSNRSISSSLTCITFVNCFLALLERAYSSVKGHSSVTSVYAVFCNYLLPSRGSSRRCAWAGTGASTAHAASDFLVLCKRFLPHQIFLSYVHVHARCVRLQALQRGHSIRKKWRLGPSSVSSPPRRAPHSTQRLATQAISAAALQVAAPPTAPSISAISTVAHTRYSAKLSAAAQELLNTHMACHSTAVTAAVLAGALPVHPAGLLRFPAAPISISSLVGDGKQKAFMELKRLVNRVSLFLRSCVQRQSCVAVAAAMSNIRRPPQNTGNVQSLDLFPVQFPVGISRVVVKSFSSGFKLHSAVRSLLSDMRSHLAGASLLLRRPPVRSFQYQRNPSIFAACVSGVLQSRLQPRSAASFVALRFCDDMPLGHSRLHLAPLADNPGVTRNQQIAALCFGQPLHGGWSNGRTHAQWLDKHWCGLAVAGALYAMQDSQLFQFVVTIDRVFMGDEQKANAATRSTIAAAHAAEGKAIKPSVQQSSCSSSSLRDSVAEFLCVCARVCSRRAVLYAALPTGTRGSANASTSALYLQKTLMLFNDLSNNFLFQLTQRQRGLLVTMACTASFHTLVSILHIQRCTRGWLARCVTRHISRRARLEQSEVRRADAQQILSRRFRAHSALCLLRGAVAVRLQRVWRGHAVRKRLVSAKIAFRAKVAVAAAEIVQRHWRCLMIQRWFSAARSIVHTRAVLFKQQKDDAVIACAQNRSRIWPHAIAHNTFVSGFCFRGLYAVLLNNQNQWMAAELLRQRNVLMRAQSNDFSRFMEKASAQSHGICLSHILRAWKGHSCRKLVRFLLLSGRKMQFEASRCRASALLQRAWRVRRSRWQFQALLSAHEADMARCCSSIIVRGVLCFRSRSLMQYLRIIAAACTVQRSFRVHAAALRMSAAAKSASEVLAILGREVAANRLQCAVRGWWCRRKCLRDACRTASQMLSWSRPPVLPFDCRLRLAIVIARHRPYLCSSPHVHPPITHVPADSHPAYSNSSASLLRHVAASCCSSVGNSIAEWGFKCIRQEMRRCRVLAQLLARQTAAALQLQAAYRAHFHRCKHFKPFLPKHRAAMMQRRRAAAATDIQCLWRSSVARLALACLSVSLNRGRWMTRTRWAHSRAKQALSNPRALPLERTGASCSPAAAVARYNYFHPKLNGWCTLAHVPMIAVLLPDDISAINTATSSSFELCERIIGFSGSAPSSNRFFGGDSTVASLLQQVEHACPQLTSRCWDIVCGCVPKDAAAFAADPLLSPAHAILSYFRQFVSGMLAQRKPVWRSDAALFNMRCCTAGGSVRAGFIVQLPAVASNSLRVMLLHSSAVVLASVHWLFSRWGHTELKGSRCISSSFSFPVSHESEFVHECCGVWSMLLHCHVRPILFCLEMLVSSASRPLFQVLHGAAAAVACSAISALLMLMSFWLQTTLHPQSSHCESSLWILFSACKLEGTYLRAYLDDSLRSNEPSIRLNIIQLFCAAVQQHSACVNAALGQQSESVTSLVLAENLLRQLSSSSISNRSASDHVHGPPSPAEELHWRSIAESAAVLFDCCSGSATSSLKSCAADD